MNDHGKVEIVVLAVRRSCPTTNSSHGDDSKLALIKSMYVRDSVTKLRPRRNPYLFQKDRRRSLAGIYLLALLGRDAEVFYARRDGSFRVVHRYRTPGPPTWLNAGLMYIRKRGS